VAVTIAPGSTSWMLARLARDTREAQVSADQDRLLALDELSPASYQRFLAITYRFEHAVEAALVGVPDLPVDLAGAVLRCRILREDLAALSTTRQVTDLLARPLAPPRLEGAADCLGWLYVVQRNTLEHVSLYRMLAPLLRVTLRMSSRYLLFQSANVYERWRGLGIHLDRFAHSTDAASRLVAAATAAFACQHACFVEGCGVHTDKAYPRLGHRR
jgi:heme oxygenase